MYYSLSIKFLPSMGLKFEVYNSVDEVIQYIISTGLSYEVGPSETTIVGTFEELTKILQKVNEIGVKQGHNSFMILANFTATKYTQEIEEKISKYQK